MEENKKCCKEPDYRFTERREERTDNGNVYDVDYFQCAACGTVQNTGILIINEKTK